MADNLTTQSSTPATVPASTVIATDDASGAHYQLVKLVNATADSTTRTGVAADPLRVDPTGTTAQPVTDNGGSLTVDGTVAISGTVAVTDNSGSLTVDRATASSATVTQVSSSASSTTLASSSGTRKGMTIFNDSTQVLYVKLGATASTSSYTVRLESHGYWEMPTGEGIYTGAVDGIWASANGNALVTTW